MKMKDYNRQYKSQEEEIYNQKHYKMLNVN